MTIQKSRSLLCATMQKTLGKEDLNANVISQRANRVLGILIDLNQISPNGFETCVDFFLSTIERSIDIFHSYSSLALVFSVFSTILQGDELGILPLEYKLRTITVIEALAMHRQYSLFNGQADEIFVTDNLRVRVSRDYLYRSLTTTYATALTPLESVYSNLPINYALLYSYNKSVSTMHAPLGMNVISYSRNIMNLSTVLTTSTLMSVYRNVINDDHITQDKLSTEILLYTLSPVNYTTGEERLISGTHFCSSGVLPYNITMSCSTFKCTYVFSLHRSVSVFL
jgi:hypothetical protein